MLAHDLINLNYRLIISVPMCPFVQLILNPSISLEVHGSQKCRKDNDFGLFFEAYINAKASVYLEMGFHIPGVFSPLEFSIGIGVNGILGEGKIGINMDIYLKKKKIDIDLYFEFTPFQLSIYILFKFKIDLKIIRFEFEFYLANKTLFQLYILMHNKKAYALP